MTENKDVKIDIKTEGAFSEIYVDGHKLNGVRSYRLEHKAGGAPILTVDLNALNLSVDGKVLLKQEGFGDINIDFSKSNMWRAEYCCAVASATCVKH